MRHLAIGLLSLSLPACSITPGTLRTGAIEKNQFGDYRVQFRGAGGCLEMTVPFQFSGDGRFGYVAGRTRMSQGANVSVDYFPGQTDLRSFASGLTKQRMEAFNHELSAKGGWLNPNRELKFARFSLSSGSVGSGADKMDGMIWSHDYIDVKYKMDSKTEAAGPYHEVTTYNETVKSGDKHTFSEYYFIDHGDGFRMIMEDVSPAQITTVVESIHHAACRDGASAPVVATRPQEEKPPAKLCPAGKPSPETAVRITDSTKIRSYGQPGTPKEREELVLADAGCPIELPMAWRLLTSQSWPQVLGEIQLHRTMNGVIGYKIGTYRHKDRDFTAPGTSPLVDRDFVILLVPADENPAIDWSPPAWKKALGGPAPTPHDFLVAIPEDGLGPR